MTEERIVTEPKSAATQGCNSPRQRQQPRHRPGILLGLMWLVALLLVLTLLRFDLGRMQPPGPIRPDYVVELNSASPAQLRALPNIGPSLANRIVGFRDKNGPFRSLAELQQVPGIGEATLEQLKPMLRVTTAPESSLAGINRQSR